jgi:amidase
MELVAEQRAAWQDIAASKIADRERVLVKYSAWRVGKDSPNETAADVSQIPLTKLSDVERAIVHADATTLVDFIRNRKYTAVDVLTAFAKVMVVAQDITNCSSEIFLDDAFTRARELDRHLEETGSVVGPLHGLPVSIKDHIKVKGIDTSTGYVCKLMCTRH